MNNFFNTLKAFFAHPVFEGDEEKTRTAKLLHQITLAIWSLPVVAMLVLLINPAMRPFVLPVAILLAITLILIMFLNQTGRVRLASSILVGIVYVALTYLNYAGAAEPRPLALLTVIVIMMSGLLLGGRAPVIVAILLVVQHVVILALAAR